MISLIKNELIKLFKRPVAYIGIGCVILGMLLFTFAEFYIYKIETNDDYTAKYANKIENLEKEKQEKTESNLSEEDKGYINIINEDIERYNLLIEYKIDYDDYRYELVSRYFNLKDYQDEPNKSQADNLLNIIKNNDYKAFYNSRIEDNQKSMEAQDISTHEKELIKSYIERDKFLIENNVYPGNELNRVYNKYIKGLENIENLKISIEDKEQQEDKQANLKSLDVAEKQIKIYEYQLENKIVTLGSSGRALFSDNVLKGMSLVIMLLIIISIIVFTSEFSKNTIGQLLLAPYKRQKIFLSKIFTMMIYSALIFALMYALSLMLSGIVFSTKIGDIKALKLVGDSVVEFEFPQYLLIRYALYYVNFIFYLLIATFTSLITKSTAGSMGILTPFILLANPALSILHMEFPNLTLEYLPTIAADFNQYFELDYIVGAYNFQYSITVTCVISAAMLILSMCKIKRLNL